MNKLAVVFELVLFVAIVVADALGWVPLTQTVLLLPFVAIALVLRREPWLSLGLSRPPIGWPRAISLGIVTGIGLEALAVLVTTPWISRIFGTEPDYSDLAGIQANALLLLTFLALNWTLAAFGEELCFRGFLLNRLAGLFGNSPSAWWLALALSSALFGWGHTEQGAAGWVQEGLSGFLLGVLFLTSRRNLVVPIIAHGVRTRWPSS